MKKRIEEAFLNHEFIKVIFQYPANTRAVVKRGLIIEVFDDGFTMEEIYDLTFSLTEVCDPSIDKVDWLKPTGQKDELRPLTLHTQSRSCLKDSLSADQSNAQLAAIAELSGYALRHVTRHSHCIDPGQDRAS